MSESITLSRAGFVTEQPETGFQAAVGSVYVYLVRWDEEKAEQKGRRIFLSEVPEGGVIPAYAWRDPYGRAFRFVLVPRESEAILEPLPSPPSGEIQRTFLEAAGIQTYALEGYEASLAEFYGQNELKDEVYQDRARAEAGKSVHNSLREIGHAVSGNGADSQGATLTERAVRWACEKEKITLPGREELPENFGALTVPEMARAGRFLCREVVLDLGFDRMDSGTLVTELEGRPVVLFRGARDRYVVHDPEDGREVPLSRDLRSRLSPKAYAVGRTLPDGAVGKKELRRFLTKSLRTGDVVQLVIWTLLTTVIGVLIPKLNQLIFDEYIPLGDMGVLVQVCVLIACCMIGNVFISIAQRIEESRLPSRMEYDLQNAVYWRLFSLPESFLRGYDSADLAQRVAGLGTTVAEAWGSLLTSGLNFLISIVYVIQMARYSGKLTWAGVLMLLGWNVMLFFLSRAAVPHERRMTAFRGEAAGRLYQFLGSVDKIRMAGGEERAMLEYIRPVGGEKQAMIRHDRLASLAAILNEAGPTVFSMVLYFLMVNGSLSVSIGAFMAFNTAFGSFSGAASALMSAITRQISLKPTMERARPVLETATETDSTREAVESLEGDIRMEHVTFAYEGGQNVLTDLSLHILPGEYVAIVGPSGSGKSTILRLLLGFEKAKSGQILYDGREIGRLDLHDLRRRLGVVLQNGRLISGSIYDNITITGKNPSMQDVQEVLEDVGLKEDIQKMPMGVHTMMSETGSTVSGGQQQRILIARAIYSKPSILFFDEATSALDNVTQARVCESLEKRKMTRVVIAHRLSTVQRCDRILVLSEGRLVEEGNYDSLMEQKGLFYDMALRQIPEKETKDMKRVMTEDGIVFLVEGDTEMASIKEEIVDSEARVTLSGNFSVAIADDLYDELSALAGFRLVMDMKEVRYLSSYAKQAIKQLNDSFRAHGDSMRLINVPANVYADMKEMGLEALLDMEVAK